MAVNSACTPLPAGGLIDPTKSAEYPIVLGERLAEKEGAKQNRLFNIQYNYKTKSATPQQQSKIRRSSRSRDAFDLTITDRVPNSDSSNNTLTYAYEGSVDPDQPVTEPEERNLVLVFDPSRKVFVLESVATQLNFNLRAAPAKTAKQVREQYAQLKTLLGDDQATGDEQMQNGTGENDGPADEDNPYDYRHFLPKADVEDEKAASDASIPEAGQGTNKSSAPAEPNAKKPTTKSAVDSSKRSQPQEKPQKKQPTKPRQTKRGPKTAAKTDQPKSKSGAKSDTKALSVPEKPESLPSDAAPGTASQKAATSPGSNIIVEGDLIIDMGSPPPSRHRVNPAHFSSNRTPSDRAEDDGKEEDVEYLQLPSPAGHTGAPAPGPKSGTAPPDGNEVEDDDALALEMEAAFAESAREEEQAMSQQNQERPQQYNAASEDESEVSEEE